MGGAAEESSVEVKRTRLPRGRASGVRRHSVPNRTMPLSRVSLSHPTVSYRKRPVNEDSIVSQQAQEMQHLFHLSPTHDGLLQIDHPSSA